MACVIMLPTPRIAPFLFGVSNNVTYSVYGLSLVCVCVCVCMCVCLCLCVCVCVCVCVSVWHNIIYPWYGPSLVVLSLDSYKLQHLLAPFPYRVSISILAPSIYVYIYQSFIMMVYDNSVWL